MPGVALGAAYEPSSSASLVGGDWYDAFVLPGGDTGLVVGDVGEESLQARRILGDEGFVAVTVVVEPSTGTIVRPVHLTTRGFSDDAAAFDPVLALVEEALARTLADGGADAHRLSQVVRRTVGTWVSNTHRRRPMIIPTVLEV